MKLFGNTHARYEALVTEYLDGVLDDAGQARLDEHLATCAECAAEVRGQQAMLAVLRATPMAEAPRSFALPYAPPVMAETRVSKWLRSMQVATATAAIVLVALVGIDFAQGPAVLDTASPAGADQLRSTEMLEAGAAAKTDSETAFGTSAIPEGDAAEPPIAGLVPNQPDAGLAREAVPTPDEPLTARRDAMDWALLVMSTFTGVLALAVVGATWLPRRPI